MSQVNQIIEQAIAKAIRQRITTQIETFVKNEVLRGLRHRGISSRNDPRERNNRSLSLVEARDFRRTVGTLVMDRIKDGVSENLRFRLKGLQARSSRDVVDTKALSDAIAAAIKTRFKLR